MTKCAYCNKQVSICAWWKSKPCCQSCYVAKKKLAHSKFKLVIQALGNKEDNNHDK